MDYSILFLLTVVFLASTYFILKRRNISSIKKLPLGSFGWPFVGETLEFLYKSPEIFITERVKKYTSDVFKTKILGEATVIFCGPAANKFIIANESKLVKVWHPPSQRTLFGMDQVATQQPPPPPPPPTQAPIPTSSSPSQPKSGIRPTGFLKPEGKFVGKFDLMMKQHLRKYWEGKEEVKAYTLAKTFTLTMACNYFMGLEDLDRAVKLITYFDDLAFGIHCMKLNFPGTMFYKANKAAIKLRKELHLIIKEKSDAISKGVVMEDLLAVLIGRNQSGKSVLPFNLVNSTMGLVTASYSSAATVITFMIKFIGERPEIYHKILSEQSEILLSRGSSSEALGWEHIQRMKYTWATACETMRLIAPLQGAFREVIDDFTYSGFTIPKGWKIYWPVNITNKNPKYFSDPENFDPSRFGEDKGPIMPYTFIPFGGGARMCAGKDYAKLVILTFIHNFVTNFKWEILFPNEKVFVGLMMPSPSQSLPLRLQPLPSSMFAKR